VTRDARQQAIQGLKDFILQAYDNLIIVKEVRDEVKVKFAKKFLK
jgi:hypothetical protein